MTQVLERLAAAGIELLPAVELTSYYVFSRDGFIALVDRTPHGFGGIGSAGILTGNGFAALVHSGERSFFVARGFEQEADPEQVELLRLFSTDLKRALGA